MVALLVASSSAIVSYSGAFRSARTVFATDGQASSGTVNAVAAADTADTADTAVNADATADAGDAADALGDSLVSSGGSDAAAGSGGIDLDGTLGAAPPSTDQTDPSSAVPSAAPADSTAQTPQAPAPAPAPPAAPAPGNAPAPAPNNAYVPLDTLQQLPDILSIDPLGAPPLAATSAMDVTWERLVQKTGYDMAYTAERSKQYNGFATPVHIVERPDRTVNFFGYGQDARTDYAYSAAYGSVFHMEFTLRPTTLNFHTFAQCGMLFNGGFNDPSRPNLYTGYAVALNNVGEGRTASVGLYQGTWDITGKIPTQYRIATYKSGIVDGRQGTPAPIQISIDIDTDKPNRPFKVFIDGEMRTEMDSAFGDNHGFGFLASYYSHYCSILTVLTLEDFSMSDKQLTWDDINDVPLTVNFKVGDTPIAEPQVYQGKERYQTFRIDNNNGVGGIPEKLIYEGKTYSLIDTQPTNMLQTDASGWSYTGAFPAGGGSIDIIYDAVAVTKTASLNGGTPASGSLASPVLARNGDKISYMVQPSNAGDPIGSVNLAPVSPAGNNFVGTWWQRNTSTGSASGGPFWAYYVYRHNAGSNAPAAPNYGLEVTYNLPKGVYENVRIPIGHFMGDCNQHGHDGRWNENQGWHGMSVALHAGSSTGSTLWAANFTGDTYGAVNNSGHGPGMLTSANALNYNTMSVTFGRIVMPTDGTVTLVLGSTRWRDYRISIGGHFEVGYGFVVGTLNCTQKSIVDEILPSGLALDPNSVRVVDPTGVAPDSTSGLTITGQSIMWEVANIMPQDSPYLAFDADVTAPDGTYAELYNRAVLKIANGGTPTVINSNYTYHTVPAAVVVNQSYIDGHLGTPIMPDAPASGQIAGNNYNGAPPANIAASQTIDQVTSYQYIGYKWDDDPPVYSATPGVVEPISKLMDTSNHLITYLYRDTRGYPGIGESYYIYDGAANSTPLPGAAATTTEVSFGGDYLLPTSKLGSRVIGADSYTYYAYSIDGGVTINSGSDRYVDPDTPLFANVTASIPDGLRLYFAKAPTVTVSFGECDLSGNAVPDTMNKAPQSRRAVYGDPLYFNDGLTQAIGSYRYYGYSIGSDTTIHQGSPSHQLSASQTSDYTIKLWFAQAVQLTLRFDELGNDAHTLKSNSLLTVAPGTNISTFSLALYYANPIVLQEGPDLNRSFQYANAYEWTGGALMSGSPSGAQVDDDMTLTLYFTTDYNITLRYHENRQPTDDSTGPDESVAILPDSSVSAPSGGAAVLGAPPDNQRFDNRIWSYIGYKIGCDHHDVIPDTIANPVDGTVFGTIWSDQSLVYVYDYDPDDPGTQLYTALVAGEKVLVEGVGEREGGTPIISSANGTAITGGLQNLMPGEQVIVNTSENAGFLFDYWSIIDSDGNEIDVHDLDMVPVGATGARFDMPAYDITVIAHYLSTSNRPTLQVSLDGDTWATPINVDGSPRAYSLFDTVGSHGSFNASFVSNGSYSFPQLPNGDFELYDGTTPTGLTIHLDGNSPALELGYYTLALTASTENHYPAGYSGATDIGGTVNLPAAGIYLAGSLVSLEATAAGNFGFDVWTLSGNAAAVLADASAANTSVTMPSSGSGAVTVSAGFERQSVQVATQQMLRSTDGSLVAGTGGSITPGGLFYKGLSGRLEATPSDGFAFVGWRISLGTGSLAYATSTTAAGFTPGVGDATLTAVFQAASSTEISLATANSIALDGVANSIHIIATNNYPNPVGISSLEWLRLPHNSAAASIDFSAASAAADAADKGTVPTADFDNFAGTSAQRSAQIPANENGRYWLRLTYSGYSTDAAAVSYTELAYVDVTNIYTAYPVYQRDYNLSFSRIITGYRQLASNQGSLPTAIPYDLHGQASGTVLSAPGAGWRSVTFTPDKPQYRLVYTIAEPDTTAWDSAADDLTVPLDADFTGSFTAFADSGPSAGHFYSINYTMDPSAWHDTTAFYVKDDTTPVTVPSGGSTSATIKVCADGSTPFNQLGGIYIPPTGSPYLPIGWYIADSPSVRTAVSSGGGGPADSTYISLTDFSQLNADFTDLIQSIVDHGQDPLTYPLLNFYVVYEERYQVTEHHYLFDPAQGGATTVKLAEDTGSVHVAGSAYSSQPLAFGVTDGLVVVGATSSDASTVFSGAALSGSPVTGTGQAKFDYAGALDASQQQFFSTAVAAVTTDITIAYYYESCTTGSQPSDRPGIPSSDLVTITSYWKELPSGALPAAPGTVTQTVKPPEVRLARRQLATTVTNDGSISGDPTHSIAAAAPATPPAAWLFNDNAGANPQAQVVGPLAPGVSTAEVTFYYLLASDGTVPDRDQWVLRHYTGRDLSSGTAQPVELKPSNRSVALTSQAFSEAAPEFPGWMYRGLVAGSYVGDPLVITSTDATLSLSAADRAATPQDTWTFLYQPGAFFSASANGVADKVTSTTVTIDFSTPITSLDVADIQLNGYGAQPGSATVSSLTSLNGGRSWEVTLSDVQQGLAELEISRYGYYFEGDGGTQTVTLCLGPGLVSAEFDGLRDSQTSHVLTLTFSKPISDLNYLLAAGVAVAGTGAEPGAATLASLGAAQMNATAVVPGTVWQIYATGGITQGDVLVTVSLPDSLYTLVPDSAAAQVWLESRYLVYRRGDAPYVTGFPPFAALPSDDVGIVFTSELTQTVVAGQMNRPNYRLYAWNSQEDLRGDTYLVGDQISLDVPWTVRAEDAANGIPVGYTELWPMWLAAPQPHLFAPVLNADGSVTFTGYVKRVTHDFRVSLQYRAVGTTAWTPVFGVDAYGVISDDTWAFFNASTQATSWTVPASAVVPGAEYEVQLFAVDAVVWNNPPSATDNRFFQVPTTPPLSGSGEVDGRFDMLPSMAYAIIVTLQEGNMVVAPPVMFVNDGTHTFGEFSFSNIADGFYNVVIDYDSYTVTRGIRVENGRCFEVVSGMEIGVNGHYLQFDLAREQSLVKILPGAPRASVDGLPELFGDALVFDSVADQDVIDKGGTVEMQMDVDYLGAPGSAGNRIPAADQSAIEADAQTRSHEVVEYYDLSLYKLRFDLNHILIDNPTQVFDTGSRQIAVSYRLPLTVPAERLAAVYRVHGGVVQMITETPNSDGEYFEISGDFIVLRVSKFSTYALALGPLGGGPGPGPGPDPGPGGGGGGTGPGGGGSGGSGGGSNVPSTGDQLWPLIVIVALAVLVGAVLITVSVIRRRRFQVSREFSDGQEGGQMGDSQEGDGQVGSSRQEGQEGQESQEGRESQVGSSRQNKDL